MPERRRLPHPAWLLLTTILLIVAGTVFYFWWEYQRVRRFTAGVEFVGGNVVVEYRGPEWLVKWAEDHDAEAYIAWLKTDVTHAYLGNSTGVGDEWPKRIQPFRNLQQVYLYDDGITDAGLEHLAGITNLQYVCLERTRVTPAGIARLRTKRPGLHIDGP